ncbi:hypothetical protein DN069_22775 [Streptacidiphilus pinicola]|uniref:Transketolase signature 1 domain-containing protein n=1 Tax=Streptacidiphilus pinicola TaxID=2219663 RepID=A0A2X0K246_9ACTN|nr:transketolase C-terminal domain-containing protein [Streptacidiphilus pinicola]RAG83345.1 hypothetical protein DN069_22775 [Streptacidiphilus pinicola]
MTQATAAPPLDIGELTRLRDLAAQLRVDSIRCSTAAASGHPTSAMSAAALRSRHLRCNWENPEAPTNDHLVFSKGHASPLMYAIGGAKKPRVTDTEQVALLGAGVTVHLCLQAADDLAAEGIYTRVLDLYLIKPIDTATLISAVHATTGRFVVVEDHHPQAVSAQQCWKPWPTSPSRLASRISLYGASPVRARSKRSWAPPKSPHRTSPPQPAPCSPRRHAQHPADRDTRERPPFKTRSTTRRPRRSAPAGPS